MKKKYYFINKFDTNSIDKQDKNTAIIYRNYNENSNSSLIRKFKKYNNVKTLKPISQYKKVVDLIARKLKI